MFSTNAIKVLEKRYFLKDENGRVSETPELLFARVAQAVAQAERKWSSAAEVSALEKSFLKMMCAQEFMPNSPTLMNAGKEKGQLSACFVLPVPDSLEGIFETCKNAALIHKTGGGTGFSFSRLRPANDRVASSDGVASGPVSFMMVYDAATEAIRQGGTRRGANMGMLRVDHPDIEEFISSKRDTSKLNNFNISVAATNQFMEAVLTDGEYDLIHPRTGLKMACVKAKEIFDKIVENAHATGEPGLIFIDRINESDPLRTQLDENGLPIAGTEDIEATNPCGEQPLGPGDACNLGSINVAKFVDQDKGDFDWDSLAKVITLAVRFLDDVIDANHYPLEFIARATLNNRRIGLGIMGWAEALILLGIPYDCAEALAKADELMSFFQENAHKASAQLAEKRGSFPNWQFSTWKDRGLAMRNATVTTIAPTGTISIIAGTSSGIEPLFAISFVRRVLGGMELVEVNPLFAEVAKKRGFFSDALMQKIAEEGTLQHIDAIPDDIKRIWVCSHDISYAWHVRMQVAFQKHTDNAVSKTINFPQNAQVEDVRQAYLLAWREGLKGITVYRDTSRRSQVLNISKTDPLKVVVKSEGFVEPLKKAIFADHMGTVTSPQIKYEDNFNRTKGSPDASWKDLHSLTIIESRGRQVPYVIHGNAQQIQAGCPECGVHFGSLTGYDSCLICVSCGYTKC